VFTAAEATKTLKLVYRAGDGGFWVADVKLGDLGSGSFATRTFMGLTRTRRGRRRGRLCGRGWIRDAARHLSLTTAPAGAVSVIGSVVGSRMPRAVAKSSLAIPE